MDEKVRIKEEEKEECLRESVEMRSIQFLKSAIMRMFSDVNEKREK